MADSTHNPLRCGLARLAAGAHLDCGAVVLLPVLSAEHVFNCIDNTGAPRDVVAVLHSWASDFEEQMALASHIGHTGCALCIVEYSDLLPDPAAAPAAPRTVHRMMTATRKLQNAWAADRLTEFDRLRSEFRMQGAVSILQVLFMRGFGHRLSHLPGLLGKLVPASVMPPDTLHVFDEGMTKRLVNAVAHHLDSKFGKSRGRWLTDSLALRFETALDMAFIEETRWPNPWLVFRPRGKRATEGCSGLQACEISAVCQLLRTLLAGILGEAKDDGWKPCKPEDDYVLDAFCTYVHYYIT